MSDELDRLRHEGARKLAKAEEDRRREAAAREHEKREKDDGRLRLAIGRYQKRHLRVALGWVMGIVVVVGIVSFVLTQAGVIPEDVGLWGWGIALTMPTLGFPMFASELLWRASQRGMRAERQWAERLPFRLEGYFETIVGLRGRRETMEVTLVYEGPWPDSTDALCALVAVVHPSVRAEPVGRGRSGPTLVLTDIEGDDGAGAARLVHDLVERVLTPIHRESPLARVILREP